jgi:hypothetical protein
VAALRELLTSRSAYEEESAAARLAAGRFVSGLDAGDMEAFLRALRPGEEARVERATIESLSPERRTLLLERLRKRR